MRCLLLILFSTVCLHAEWRDPGFESQTVGDLNVTGRKPEGWEIQKTGRKSIQSALIAAVTEAGAHTGKRCMELKIPEETKGFEFVTVGQRLAVDPNAICKASVWVRWKDGPEKAPQGASATSGHPSAIVSGLGSERGRASFRGGMTGFLTTNGTS
jgi:hypothetical protein